MFRVSVMLAGNLSINAIILHLFTQYRCISEYFLRFISDGYLGRRSPTNGRSAKQPPRRRLAGGNLHQMRQNLNNATHGGDPGRIVKVKTL